MLRTGGAEPMRGGSSGGRWVGAAQKLGKQGRIVTQEAGAEARGEKCKGPPTPSTLQTQFEATSFAPASRNSEKSSQRPVATLIYLAFLMFPCLSRIEFSSLRCMILRVCPVCHLQCVWAFRIVPSSHPSPPLQLLFSPACCYCCFDHCPFR